MAYDKELVDQVGFSSMEIITYKSTIVFPFLNIFISLHCRLLWSIKKSLTFSRIKIEEHRQLGTISVAKERYNLIGRAGHWWETKMVLIVNNCNFCIPK